MDSFKSGFTQIIYPISYFKTPQQHQAHPAFHQTSKDLDSSKLEHTCFNNTDLLHNEQSEDELDPHHQRAYAKMHEVMWFPLSLCYFNL